GHSSKSRPVGCSEQRRLAASAWLPPPDSLCTTPRRTTRSVFAALLRREVSALRPRVGEQDNGIREGDDEGGRQFEGHSGRLLGGERGYRAGGTDEALGGGRE